MAFFLFKIANMSFSAFQWNAQPLPPAIISGVWGYVTNKHLAGIPGTGFLLNTQSYVRLHCLPILSRIRDKIGYTESQIIPNTSKEASNRGIS
ncbi:hypothetical protein [[Clostridium] scindens]|nr:hypothetical protein [[Clostridium] scindens]